MVQKIVKNVWPAHTDQIAWIGWGKNCKHIQRVPRKPANQKLPSLNYLRCPGSHNRRGLIWQLCGFTSAPWNLPQFFLPAKSSRLNGVLVNEKMELITVIPCNSCNGCNLCRRMVNSLQENLIASFTRVQWR